MAAKIKKGDKVVVITGRDAGKTGEVVQVMPKETRAIVRGVNEARRKEGLHVTDRIHLVLDPEHHEDVRAAIERHKDYITAETLAVDLVLAGQRLADGHRLELADGRAVYAGLSARS